MSLVISTNIPSIRAQTNLKTNTKLLDRTMQRLGSGFRINQASDDAAGLAISENLKAQIRSLLQASRNANDAISLVQVAEGGLNEISNIVIRLRELSIQAASDTVGPVERQFIDVEFQQLKQEIDRIAQGTEFNGTTLLNGTGGIFDFQVGTRNDPLIDRLSFDSTVANSTTAALGIAATAGSTKEDARTSLSNLDNAQTLINSIRANFGALQNRLGSVINNIAISHENLSAANSRIRDADIAEETAELTRATILQQAGTSVLKTANDMKQIALKLLG